jgi:imidazolonepropionase-like amidohydrolase
VAASGASEALRFSGTVLPDLDSRDLYVVDGRVTYEPVPGAEHVASNVWFVPGLVDAHCHVGLTAAGAADKAEQEAQALQDRDAGVLTIRDCGSPADTRWIDDRPDLPRIIRAGRHIARPKRYIREVGLEVEPHELVDTVTAEVARGDGWIKLVGDWIDREVGDLAPLWPRDVLAQAIATAHDLGARVTAHSFSEDALPDLIGAGIDCIEHGTGLSTDLIDEMARRQTALVPTLINIERFPEIARSASRYPAYAAHMLALHETVRDRVREAYEAGVPIFAGTDAGSELRHGRIAEEIVALHDAGLSASDALAAASWRARDWLGVNNGLVEGDLADFVAYDGGPGDLTQLHKPRAIVLGGRLIRAG